MGRGAAWRGWLVGAATGAGAGASSRGARIGAGWAGFTFFTAGASGMFKCDLLSACVGSLRGVPRW